MKRTTILINMAGDPFWKKDDVASGPRKPRIASDVYEVEPPAADHPLLAIGHFRGNAPTCRPISERHDPDEHGGKGCPCRAGGKAARVPGCKS